MANNRFPQSYFEDNTISYDHPEWPATIELEVIGVKVKSGETVEHVSGMSLVISYVSDEPSSLPKHIRFSPTSSHNWLKGETVNITGPHGKLGYLTLEARNAKTEDVVIYETLPLSAEQQAAPEDISSAEPVNGLIGSKFISNELQVSYTDGIVEFHGLRIPYFKSSDVTFYNVSGNVTALVTFDGKNPDGPIIWGPQNLTVWEEGATVEAKGPLLSTVGPIIELSVRSGGLVVQRQIFRHIHPSASDKKALAKLAEHKSWDAYVTSRKVGVDMIRVRNSIELISSAQQ